jgi:AcrR family transcriptional regulator
VSIPAELGRRERRKVATREAIASAALRLFLERGYRDVSIKDIAAEADVAVATVFSHFAGKEEIIFDRSDEIRGTLVSAVVDRPAGDSILDALERWAMANPVVRSAQDPDFQAFKTLVLGTPELEAAWRRLWHRHGQVLAEALVAESAGHPWQLSLPEALSVAHTVLDSCDLARSDAQSDQTVRKIFHLLRYGWAH